MNNVDLIGRLTRDPELRSMGSSDRWVCDLRVAVDNGVDSGGEKRDPLYIDVSTFDRQAEACAQHLSKGRQVAVSGRLVYREWEADDGSKRSKHSIIGRVEFLGSPSGSNGSEPEPAAEPAAVGVGASDEDIPF
jgi:single-strand DNA-binding protein